MLRRLWEDFIQICQENKSLYGMTYTQIKQNILGVEMRLTWGLNPLASEFEPQRINPFTSTRPATSSTFLAEVPPLASWKQRVTTEVAEVPPVSTPPAPRAYQPPFLPNTNQFRGQFYPVPLGWRGPMPTYDLPPNPYYAQPLPPLVRHSSIFNFCTVFRSVSI